MLLDDFNDRLRERTPAVHGNKKHDSNSVFDAFFFDISTEWSKVEASFATKERGKNC